MENKLFFMNDYGESVHPSIVSELAATNLNATCGYGLDVYCRQAAECILEKVGAPQAEIHFMVGGTSANMIALSAFMRPYEAVIAAATGHINVHETGAVEGSGHKVLVCESKDGKVTPEGVQAVCDGHPDEHMVHPRVLYISQSTEVGTVYTLSELRTLRAVCDKNDLLLYVDGARLGCALTSEGCDVTLKDLGALTDAFYIGGTKNGLMFGEAMVLVNLSLQKDFRYMIKNRGGMLAKGRIMGIQFLTAFKEDAYFEWARHANAMAAIVREAMRKKGIEEYQMNTTNQIFAVFTRDQIDRLSERVEYEKWADLPDGRAAVRFVTSWATQEKDARALAEWIEAL